VPLLIGLHLVLFTLAYGAAYLLRFDFRVSPNYVSVGFRTLPVVLAVHIAIFWVFRSYYGWWRYVTFRDLVGFIPPLVLSGILLWVLGHLVPPAKIPGSILALNMGLSAALLILSRSSWRLGRELSIYLPSSQGRRKERALMISNHHDTLVLANQINSQPYSSTRIVGILAKEKYPRGTTRAGIPVMGGPLDAPELSVAYGVTQVWLVAGSIPGPELLELKKLYDQAGLRTQVIPAATDRSPSGSFIPVREIDINDLLQRDCVALDDTLIREQLTGRRVLVTGAGGSIGSEICRQVLKFRPSQLVLVDHRENSVFLIHNELSALQVVDSELVPAVGDVLDQPRMSALFDEYRPEVVYHAAAHKHVGLMETNPGQAVQNNVLGTKIMADMADQFGVRKFVLVSTDKAVNPTSVMGCTKQIAERYVLSLGARSKTGFIAVRFGNVLGSAGSVVPIFKEQIARGGPLTITDEEMTRYFMTIPEASQLVIQAGCMGDGGEIFVLDMGEPVKIVELARKMIQLAGLPESAIQIRFTGARPGEKLFEELYFDEEKMISTPHEKVFAAKHRTLDYGQVSTAIEALLAMVHEPSTAIRAKLQEIVPEYHPTQGTRAVPVAAAAESDKTDSEKSDSEITLVH
jgi:FlaA1/EpsC-like NDP-sugar epimerase